MSRLSLLILLLPMLFPAVSVAEVEFRFCYENREVKPHFFGDSGEIPAKPGPAIEIIKELARSVPEIKLTMFREPWARCIGHLKTGKASAITGSFSKARAKFARFPMHKGEVDARYSIKTAKSCLLTQSDIVFNWDGKSFKGISEMTIGVPKGYKAGKVLRDMGINVFDTDSPEKGLWLAKHNRIEGTLVGCNETVDAPGLKKHPVPIYQNQGYLMMSQVFFDQNSALAWKIWQALKEIDHESFYQNLDPDQT